MSCESVSDFLQSSVSSSPSRPLAWMSVSLTPPPQPPGVSVSVASSAFPDPQSFLFLFSLVELLGHFVVTTVWMWKCGLSILLDRRLGIAPDVGHQA